MRFSGAPGLGSGWFENCVEALVKLIQPWVHVRSSVNSRP